jgi:hypothetical protein
MISTWWLLAAFFGGGCAGLLIFALMQISADQPEMSTTVSELDLDFSPTQW